MEMGHVHRFELSGVLHGLFRARAFTQDDGHIYCTPEQMEGEIVNFVESIFSIYCVFGLNDVEVLLATRPKHSMGSDEVWEMATACLKNALEKNGTEYKIKEGEGAFYGPKIEFNIKDCIKRNWQLGTIQVDFSMPERFGLEYIATDGERKRPVLLHRAVLGSLERFIGIFIEHVAGVFPPWLAPVQAVIIPITDNQNGYSELIAEKLKAEGLRVETDFSSERLNRKIRQAQLLKIPYMIIIGAKEEEVDNISVRLRTGENINSISREEFVAAIKAQTASRSHDLWPEKNRSGS
jgi:threonyl-tRNA synthetase